MISVLLQTVFDYVNVVLVYAFSKHKPLCYVM